MHWALLFGVVISMLKALELCGFCQDPRSSCEMPESKPAEKTPEELDEEKLREAESRIKELLALMSAGHTRPKADERLGKAREKRGEHEGNTDATFHKPGGTGKPVSVTRDTASLLELAESLELRIKLGGYALELQDALNRYTAQKVDVLERMLKRARY